MKMVESKFRIWAKAVAIVELIIHSITLALLCILTVTFLVLGFDAMPAMDRPATKNPDAVFVTVFEIVFVIIIGVLVLSMWFSYNLLVAATNGTDPSEALRRAKRWRISAIVIFILSLFSLGEMQHLGGKIIGIILQIIFIYVVHCFIDDLETAQHDTAMSLPGAVPLVPLQV